jgi:hypothetical protein
MAKKGKQITGANELRLDPLCDGWHHRPESRLPWIIAMATITSFPLVMLRWSPPAD